MSTLRNGRIRDLARASDGARREREHRKEPTTKQRYERLLRAMSDRRLRRAAG